MSPRFLIPLLTFLLLSPARADTFTWAGNDGAFSAPTSWIAPAPLPGGSADDVLVLPTPLTPTNAYALTNDFSAPWKLNSLVLGTTTNATPASITLDGAPSASLLFDGPNPSIIVSPLGYHGISLPIASTSNLTITGAHLSLSGSLSFTAPDSQLDITCASVGYANNAPPTGLIQTVISGNDTRGSGLVWWYTPNNPSSTLSFGLGTITLDNAAYFGLHNALPYSIIPSQASLEITNPFVIQGNYTQLGVGGFASVTCSGPFRLAGDVLLFTDTTLTLTGSITLDQSAPRFLRLGSGQTAGLTGGTTTAGNLIDDPDPAHAACNPVHLYDVGIGLNIAGTANTFSSGTIIDGGTVIVAPYSTLGTGAITIGNPSSYWYSPQLILCSPTPYAAAAHVNVYGTLAFVGPAGAIPSTSAPPSLLATSNLVLGDNLTHNSDRYPDSMPLDLNSSTLQLLAFGDTTETVGAFSFTGISSIILQNPDTGSHTATLHAPQLTRNDNAILLITPVNGVLGLGTGNVNLLFGTPPIVTNNMLPPYIQLADTRRPMSPNIPSSRLLPSFVTYGATGVAPVPFTAMPSTGGTGTEIVDLSGYDNNTILFNSSIQALPSTSSPFDQAVNIALLHAFGVPYNAVFIPSNTSIYALRTTTSIANPLTGPVTLTLQSGGLITCNFALSSDGKNTITVAPNLNFGTGEVIIHTAADQLYYDSFPSVLSGRVTIQNGLTKLGHGPLILSNPANDISGPITVFQGALTLFDIPQAMSSLPISLYPDSSINTLSSQTLSRPILLLPGLSSRATIGISVGNTLTLASTISGNGELAIQSGTLILDPTLTWHPTNGGIIISSAVILPNATITLPTAIVISGGLSGTGAFANYVALFLEGTISPGTSPGDIATLKFDSPAALARLGWFQTVVLDLDPAGPSDQLLFTGPLLLEPALDPGNPTALALNFLAPPTGKSYTLISASSLTGTFSQVTGLPDGYSLDYTPTSILLVPTSPQPDSQVPEPPSLIFLSAATLALVLRRRH